jgi:hypothetical protein
MRRSDSASITSTCPVEAQEGTPTRRQVEASCEVTYANAEASWPAWSHFEALWTACLSPAVCVQARMCRRQRARRAQIRKVRAALRPAYLPVTAQ